MNTNGVALPTPEPPTTSYGWKSDDCQVMRNAN